jgi:ornithine cyclodeaminase
MRIITHSRVVELLPMADCMEIVAQALADLSRGEGQQPLRGGMLLPGRRGVLAWMPGALAEGRPFGVKLLSVFEEAPAMGLDSHQGGIMLFEPELGRPIALIEAGAVTAIRTAAVSAVATRILARRDCRRLAVLGSGIQARSHLEAMLEVRRIRSVVLWSRSADNARKLADWGSARLPVEITVVDDPDEAVRDADIVCTTTPAKEPILHGAAVRPGTHINAVGASVPSQREIDDEALRTVRLFTDRRESLENEAGEYIHGLETGIIDRGHLLAEIGDLVNGDHPGRTSADEITLFRSLGIAVEDVAAAQLIYERAVQKGIGTEVDLSR